MTPADLLRAAAAWRPADDSSPNVAIAAAQYQESVFRDIDVVIRRGGPAGTFDDVTAQAVDSLPDTMVGPIAMCNAQIRATVAILRTAVRIAISRNGSSATKNALMPVFNALSSVSRWRNPGIAEGCFQALPTLLPNPAHADLGRTALDALFIHLQPPADTTDPARLHVHLVSASCFRKLLVALAATHSNTSFPGDVEQIESHIAALFLRPSRAAVLAAFRGLTSNVPSRGRGTTADLLLSGAAFDIRALQSTRAKLHRWHDLEPEEQMLFVRTLALQLKASTGEWRDVERFALLREHYKRMSTIVWSAQEREVLLWDLLAELPAETAESMDAEVQAFAENSNRRTALQQSSARIERLPGYILAMISPVAGDRITDLVVREIDLKLRQARSRHESFDLGSLLYAIFLRNPHERLFDQLLPRLSAERDHDETLLFRNLVRAIAEVEIAGSPGDVLPLLAATERFLSDARNTISPTVRSLSLLLKQFRCLVSEDERVWAAIGEGDTGGLGALFSAFDELASCVSDGPQQGRALATECRERLADLQSEVEFYQRLPVEEFDGRARTLERARDIADELIVVLRAHDRLYVPERVLLVAVVHYLRTLFERTKRWYCVEPQRQWKSAANDVFWPFFAADRHERALDDSETIFRRAHRRVVAKAGPEPPPYVGQRARFERFFVRWMSSEIDAQALAVALRPRWPLWFRSAFMVMTSYWIVALLVLLPCFVAISMHQVSLHEFEGAGFFVVYAGFAAMTILALGSVGLRLSLRWKRKKQASDRSPTQYWLKLMFPRVAGFIAAPMALIVELEHAYTFPMEAPDGALLLLMLAAVLAIWLAVKNAVAEDEDGGVTGKEDHEALVSGTARRVSSIVAVALAQSFLIALLLSVIFVGHIELPKASPYHDRLFLNVLPREVELNIPLIARHAGYVFAPKAAPLLHFAYYPTIILTWTALGLLFGVVFEGFLKGAKVRGERALEQEG